MSLLLSFFIYAFSAFAGCDTSALETANKPQDFHELRDLPDKNESEVMRSNPRHFWQWLTSRAAEFEDSVGLFEPKGVVFGDSHVDNFHVIPISGKNRFAFIDFDDGGVASFFADFARFVSTTKATYGRIKIKDLLDAHIMGLLGKRYPTPERIRVTTRMSRGEYLTLRNNYIDQTRVGEKIKMDRNELSRAADSEKESVSRAIGSIFPNVTILDVARFTKKRGGSANGLRYWVLVKSNDRSVPYDVFEVKELQVPGTEAWQTQDNGIDRLNLQRKAFWPKTNDERYSSVAIGDRGFEVRPKKINLYDNEPDAREMALYTAYVMGVQYAKQRSAGTYTRRLMQNIDVASSTLRLIFNEYRKIATDHLEQNNDH